MPFYRWVIPPKDPVYRQYTLIQGHYESTGESRSYTEEFGETQNPLDGYEPISATGGIYCNYTSEDLLDQPSTGRVVALDLIYYKDKVHVRPRAPIYQLPKRKELVRPRILSFIPKGFWFRKRLPSENRASYARERDLARLRHIIGEVSRERRMKTSAGRILANFEKKLARRRAFLARYKAVYKRRLAKYERRLALFEQRRRKLLMTRPRAPANRNIFHDHSLVLIKNVRVVEMEMYYLLEWTFGYPNFSVSYSIYNPASPSSDLRGLISESLMASHWSDRAYPRNLLDGLRGRVGISLTSKLKNQEFHVGNALAQYKQTLELLHDSLVGIGLFFKSPARAVKELVQILKSPYRIADNTLSVTFGAEPLIADLKGIYNILKAGLPQQSGMVSIRSSHSTSYRGPVNIGNLRLNVEGVLTVRRVLHYNVENPVFRILNQLGLLNVAEVAWELMPWSFVIDWFLKVGEAISSLTAEVGLKRSNNSSETISFRGIVIDLPGTTDQNQTPNYQEMEALSQEKYNPLEPGRYWEGTLRVFTSRSLGGTIKLKQRKKLGEAMLLSPEYLLATMPEFGIHRISETAALTLQQIRKVASTRSA